MPNRFIRNSRAPHPINDDATAATQDPLAPAPGAELRQNLQNRFLTGLLNQTVTVYLVNGIRLAGTLKQFDAFTVLLQDVNDIGTLVFKHAISTLVPGAPTVSKEPRPPFKRWAGPTA